MAPYPGSRPSVGMLQQHLRPFLRGPLTGVGGNKVPAVARLCSSGCKRRSYFRHHAIATSNAPPSFEKPEYDVEDLWRRLDKSVSIGKSGLQPSHLTLIQDALSLREAVKVKFVVRDGVMDLAQRVCEQAGAEILMVKGVMVMFGAGDANIKALNANAKEYLEKQKQIRVEKKKAKTEGVKLPPTVTAKMKSLEEKGVLSHSDFDRSAQRAFASLSEEEQMGILKGLTKKELKKIKNRSAWLTSRVTLVQKSREGGVDANC